MEFVMRFSFILLAVFPLLACQTPQKSDPVFSDAEVKKMVAQMEQDMDRGEILDKHQINTLLAKKNVRGVTREGERIGFSLSNWKHTHDLFSYYYDEHGRETGRDKGSWWIAGLIKLCGRLQNFDNAKSHCFTVTKQDEEFALINGRSEQVYRFRVVGDYDPSASSQHSASKNSNDNEKEPGEYHIGRLIGYTQICGEFRGSGADPQMINTIKQLFATNPDFKRGYAEFDNFTGFDFVTGLNNCEEVKAGVEKIYSAIKATAG